jgi:hypothetical protein
MNSLSKKLTIAASCLLVSSIILPADVAQLKSDTIKKPSLLRQTAQYAKNNPLALAATCVASSGLTKLAVDIKTGKRDFRTTLTGVGDATSFMAHAMYLTVTLVLLADHLIGPNNSEDRKKTLAELKKVHEDHTPLLLKTSELSQAQLPPAQ